MEPNPPPRLVLFPGLGVDARVYAPQRQGLPIPIECPNWIEPESDRETLAHFSRRMAAKVGNGGRLYLGGISMGAMVALEAARHLDAAGVIMIGGCRSNQELSPTFQAGISATAAMPRQWIRPFLKIFGPLGFKLFEDLPPAEERLMLAMMLQHSPRQLRWSAKAVADWTLTAEPCCPVYSIHGAEDEVIPVRNVRPDRSIPGGRHLINLSHPREVNAFIAKVIGLPAFTLDGPSVPSRP